LQALESKLLTLEGEQATSSTLPNKPASKRQSKAKTKPLPLLPFTPPPPKKIMKDRIWLRVENNSKFVRGKGKVRNEIEQFVLSHYSMEKPKKNGREYFLSIP
jgi:hypothetical protein